MKHFFSIILLLNLFTLNSFSQENRKEQVVEMPDFNWEKKLDKGVFLSNNYYGLKYKDRVVLQPIYEDIDLLPSGEFYAITQNDKVGICNVQGDILIPCQFVFIYSISNRSDWFKVASKDHKWGIVDSLNTLILPIKYDNIHEKDFGLILNHKREQGYFDFSGKILLEPAYDNIVHLAKTDNSILLYKDSLYSILENDNSLVHDKRISNIIKLRNKYNKYFVYSEGLNEKQFNNNFYIIMDTNNRYGVYDFLNSKTVIPIGDDTILFYNDEDFVLKNNEKHGLVNANGDTVIGFVYDNIEFQNIDLIDNLNTLIVSKNGKFGLIDKKNNKLTDFIYEEIYAIKGSFYRAKLGKNSYHVLSSDGVVLNNKVYKFTGTFENGRLPVFDENKMYYIDSNGKKSSDKFKIEPHIGYDNLDQINLDFIACLKSKDDKLLWDFTLKISPSNYTIEYLTSMGMNITKLPSYLIPEAGITVDYIQSTYFNHFKELRDSFVNNESDSIEVRLTYDYEKLRNNSGLDKDRKYLLRYNLAFHNTSNGKDITLDNISFIEGNMILFSTFMLKDIVNKRREFYRSKGKEYSTH